MRHLLCAEVRAVNPGYGRTCSAGGSRPSEGADPRLSRRHQYTREIVVGLTVGLRAGPSRDGLGHVPLGLLCQLPAPDCRRRTSDGRDHHKGRQLSGGFYPPFVFHFPFFLKFLAVLGLRFCAWSTLWLQGLGFSWGSFSCCREWTQQPGIQCL